MHVISFLNQKGGVGKTSATFHTAGALAALGLRVLLVDNDPQASLTQGILGPAATEALDPAATIHGIYQGAADAVDPVRPTDWPLIDLIPGCSLARDFNHPVGPGSDLAPCEYLAELMRGASRYDFALIDCPPNLHQLAWAALTCATPVYCVVPVQPEDYGAQGLAPVLEFAQAVRAAGGAWPVELGYLLTMVDRRTSIHKLYESKLRDSLGGRVFDAVMPRLVAFSEAITERRPVELAAPRSAAALAMRSIADELRMRIDLERIAGRRQPAKGKGAARASK